MTDFGSCKILIAIINFILLNGIFDLPVFSKMASPHSLQKVQLENHSNNLYSICHVCSSLTWTEKWMYQEAQTRAETGRHIYETHRCVSKKQDIEHITVQNITFRMNWPGMGKQVHQSSVKAAVFSTGGKNRWVTARITAQDTGCYRSTFPLIHVHQPDAIFRPYPSNQIICLSYCVLEIQIKWNINQMITNIQKTANTKFSLPYAALYLLF